MLKFWLQADVLRFIIFALLQGLSVASILPVLSSYLSADLGITAFWIGVFISTTTLAGLVTSFWLASRSDRGLSRVYILRFGICSSLLGALIMSCSRSYPLMMCGGTLWLGVSACVLPQMFALAREQIGSERAVLFQSVMRAAFAVSWVAGPPLAFYIYSHLGFQKLMWMVVVIFISMIMMTTGLQDQNLSRGSTVQSDRIWRPEIMALVLIFSVISMSNSMYLVYMPLYVVQTLEMSKTLPGQMMGLAAFCEIPLMILAGYLVGRSFRMMSFITSALAAGVLFYFCLIRSDEVIYLFLIQGLNAIFIGISASLGMSVFQSLMPSRIGMATSLYNNSNKIGSLCGSLLGGCLAQWYGYSYVFMFALICLVAVLLVSVRLSFLIKV